MKQEKEESSSMSSADNDVEYGIIVEEKENERMTGRYTPSGLSGLRCVVISFPSLS